MSTSDQGLPAGLRQATVTGFAWKALAELVVQLTRIIILVLLARILSPHDFGVAGIVLAFGVVIPVLSDMALGAALIHLRTLDAAHKATVFWSTVALGSAFTGIGIALSGTIAGAFGNPELKPLFAAFCFALLFASLASTPLALLTREMNFRALELRQMASTLLGGAAAVVIAIMGGGAWALIGQYLVTSGSSLTLMWLLCGYRPTREFSFPILRQLAGYSSGIFGASLLSQFGPSSQTLLAGRLLGTRPLGELLLAQQLVMLPFNRIAAPIQEVLFPAFSRMQDEPGRIAVAWGRANQLVGAIAIPGLVGVALVAPELVVVVFGDRWSDLDILLRVLAIVGIVQALQRLNFSILQARGRSTSLLWVSAVGVILGLLGVAVGSRFGVVGVACGIALTSTLTQLAFMAVTARAVNVTLLSCLRPLTGVVAATAVMSMAVLGARQLCDTISVEDALALASEVAVGTIVYLAAISVFGRDMLRSVRSILADRRRERRGDSFVSGEVEGT